MEHKFTSRSYFTMNAIGIYRIVILGKYELKCQLSFIPTHGFSLWFVYTEPWAVFVGFMRLLFVIRAEILAERYKLEAESSKLKELRSKKLEAESKL
jgi:hypothetical protein